MRFSNRRTALVLGVSGVLAGFAPLGSAQDFPRKQITIVVPYAAGGGADAVARLLAADITKKIGHQVLVDNRPGANGHLGTGLVARAAPDGYTLLLVPPNPIVNSKLLYKKLPFDAERDLAPVSKLVESPFAIMAYPARYPDIQSLIAYAKANPGKVNVGTNGNGASGHLLGLAIEANTGARFNMVPYKGSAQMVGELMTGRIDMTVDYPSAYLGQIEAKSIRVLATLGNTRSPFLPNAPTMKEAGFGVEGVGWFGLYAPKGVPADLQNRLNSLFKESLQTPTVATQLAAMGYGVVASTPAELEAYIQSESAKLAVLVKAANISLD